MTGEIRFSLDVQKSLFYYIHRRMEPGGFLRAVLCNNLKSAVTLADDRNFRDLAEIVKWVYNNAPAECWGSVEAYKSWLNGETK